MRKINMRKLRDELEMITMVIVGIVLLILNFFKITPGMDTAITTAITIIIAYGTLIGIIFIILGIAGLIEIINTDYTHKKSTHK